MSCGELERLFVAGASEEKMSAHRASCAACARLGSDLDRVEASPSDLRPPALSPALREALLSVIPLETVSCEGADRLIAAALEGALPAADAARLEAHCSRCEACAETSRTLAGVSDFARRSRPRGSPAASPRTGPRRQPRGWRILLNPKAVIAMAYAAAVVVMLAGFNPADLARKAGIGRIEETARASVQVAGNSLADRLGAAEESVLRTLAVWKGHVTGYGRAAISTAIAFVMKEEQRPPSRPRSGEDKGVLQKNEIETSTWRA